MSQTNTAHRPAQEILEDVLQDSRHGHETMIEALHAIQADAMRQVGVLRSIRGILVAILIVAIISSFAIVSALSRLGG